MAFKEGDPKPANAGRKAGTPNKRTLEIKEYAESCGVSPANYLIDILAGKRDEIAGEAIDKNDMKWAIDALLPYMYGKRKPVDSNGDDSNDPLTAFIEALSASK